MAKRTKATKTANVETKTETVPTTEANANAMTTTAPVATTGDAPAAAQTARTGGTESKPRGSNVIPGKSTVEKPTKAVWTIAEEMTAANPQTTRKDIVDECVRRGVAYLTARTQYQRWSKSKTSSR